MRNSNQRDRQAPGKRPGELNRPISSLEEVSRLTAKLAHDLRGSLNLISGYADLLAMQMTGPLTAKQAKCVEFIQTGKRRIEIEIDHFQNSLDVLAHSNSSGSDILSSESRAITPEHGSLQSEDILTSKESGSS
jgi:signal transduction histidine kinase